MFPAHISVCKINVTLILLFACCVSVSADETLPIDPVAPADGEPTADTVLTIDHAVSLALANNPAIHAAETSVVGQQHLVYQATRKPNPTVGYLASEVGNEGQAGQQGVFLSQNIVRGNKLCLDGHVQQRDVSIAAHELQVRRFRVEADARLAFIEVAVTQERLKLLNRLQTSLERAVGTVQRLVSAGESSLSASLQSKLEAQRNAMRIQLTENQSTVARRKLATALGRETLNQPVVAAVLLPKDFSIDIEQAWADVLATSPELAVATSRLDRSQWKVRREQAEPVPDLQTQWSIQQDAATHYAVVGIQLGVALPVRNDNTGAINAARADTWRTHHEIDAVRRSLRQRLLTTVGQLQQADQQLKTIKSELESLARENLLTTQRAFALGEASYLDLLNAQRGYIRLSLDTLDLYQQRSIAESHLQTSLVHAAESPDGER
ncbi:MAG: TolC family protein [Fuerstiella sp.]|nr:TolC family protein [Fuerstiella sp.]MCP4858955.1 TolC family protein [Fuerstiella sp.]